MMFIHTKTAPFLLVLVSNFWGAVQIAIYRADTTNQLRPPENTPGNINPTFK